MEQTIHSTEATWGDGARIWWWIMWRSILGAIAGGFVIGFVIGLVASLMGVDIESIQIIVTPLGALVGAIINIFFTKKVIGKQFKDFKLVLIRNNSTEVTNELVQN